MAKQLIDLAKDSGFDAVKFQKETQHFPPESQSQNKNNSSSEILILNIKKIKFNKKEFDEINFYCKKTY